MFQGTNPALTLAYNYYVCKLALSAMSDMLVNRQRLKFPNPGVSHLFVRLSSSTAKTEAEIEV